jgi:hypothetical protein
LLEEGDESRFLRPADDDLGGRRVHARAWLHNGWRRERQITGRSIVNGMEPAAAAAPVGTAARTTSPQRPPKRDESKTLANKSLANACRAFAETDFSTSFFKDSPGDTVKH